MRSVLRCFLLTTNWSVSFSPVCISTDQSRIFPSEITRSVGEKAVFTCDTDKKPTWKWLLKNTLKTPVGAKMQKKTLTFKKVELKHRGFYECLGSYEGIKFRSEAVLKILGIIH